MPMTIQPNPTRRTAIGFSITALVAGMTVPAVAETSAPNPDADLLALCAEFDRSGERVGYISGIACEMTEDDLEAEIERWYETMEQIAVLTPTTPQGWKAKIAAATQSLASTAPVAGYTLEREEQFALDTLRGMLEALT